jgi:hypothetical protein
LNILQRSLLRVKKSLKSAKESSKSSKESLKESSKESSKQSTENPKVVLQKSLKNLEKIYQESLKSTFKNVFYPDERIDEEIVKILYRFNMPSEIVKDEFV